MSVIKALGEIALRVAELPPMVDYYQNVIGLKLMRLESNFAFFHIGEGHEGHTQVLALFDRSERPDNTPPDGSKSTVDHIAFNISLPDFESEKDRLESLGQNVTLASHSWVQWRSLYVVDPEGNTVEFVCFDPSIASE